MEPFRMEQYETNEQFVLKLGGELDLAVVPQLQAAVDPYLRRTDLAMILDLEGLKYIDSTGIGIIVSILKTRDSVNAPFYVRNIPSTVRRLFDMTGLTGYLKEEAGA